MLIGALPGRRRAPYSLRGRDILVRVDLRGLPRDTYDLHVAITRRATTNSVTQVRYRACIPPRRG